MSRFPLVAVGAVLVVLGLIGFAIPIFTPQETTELARIGELKLQTTETTSHISPPQLSGGALVLGVVLIGRGFTLKKLDTASPAPETGPPIVVSPSLTAAMTSSLRIVGLDQA